jgi:uncharacterized oxidoreductase
MTQKKIVFITGGSSGIGSGLAKAFHANGATVIIAGRDVESLSKVAKEHPGMETCKLDVSDPLAVTRCAQELAKRYPNLNVIINNAGIQRLLDFSANLPPTFDQIDPEIETNFKGMIYVTSGFLPLLRRQPWARIINVSSGLGFVPLVKAPIYSATKAAQHAFTVSLREQLRGTSVQVIELIPPVVKTNLHKGQERQPPRAMTLDDFITQAMRGLESNKLEIPVGLAKVLRVGSRIAPERFLKIVNRSAP